VVIQYLTRNFQVADSNLIVRPFASNLEQVADLRCAQVNLASYPLRGSENEGSLRATR